ncbi:MAG TPA: hypothetical protein VFC45_00775 [Pseudolabrys sp.]|nr:hypothetical protein [Pseudolabrys sp.]
MAEFGDIFDYQLSTAVLECLTVGFMAAYALAVVWAVTSVKNRVFSPHPA